MYAMKNPWILSIISILLGLGLLGIMAQTDLLTWINDAFLLGMGCLVISAALFVIRGGFFRLFARSFKKFNHWLFSPKTPLLNRGQEEVAISHSSSEWQPLLMVSGLIVGIFFISLSLILLSVI